MIEMPVTGIEKVASGGEEETKWFDEVLPGNRPACSSKPEENVIPIPANWLPRFPQMPPASQTGNVSSAVPRIPSGPGYRSKSIVTAVPVADARTAGALRSSRHQRKAVLRTPDPYVTNIT